MLLFKKLPDYFFSEGTVENSLSMVSGRPTCRSLGHSTDEKGLIYKVKCRTEGRPGEN